MGIYTATSPELLPKMLQLNYIAAWTVLFGLPCTFLFWLSLRGTNLTRSKENSPEKPIQQSLQTAEKGEKIIPKKDLGENDEFYWQAFSQLSKKEADPQEAQEVDMDFEDEN
jgi:hypothetical protein